MSISRSIDILITKYKKLQVIASRELTIEEYESNDVVPYDRVCVGVTWCDREILMNGRAAANECRVASVVSSAGINVNVRVRDKCPLT